MIHMKHSHTHLWALSAFLAWLIGLGTTTRGAPPYSTSRVVDTIQWTFESHIQHGPGSDQWPLTWADDDNLYAAWGDGWGWRREGPKRSIGVTRISGVPPKMQGEDIWGAGPGSGFGKPEALIAYGGKIYMFWTVGRSKDDKANTGTAYSGDQGVTWVLNKGKSSTPISVHH